MSAPTPGPWRMEPWKDMDGFSHVAIDGENGPIVNVDSHDSDGTQANARLIAAAPTMYEELRQEVEVLERLASRCDAWARESKESGWSTHQVAANRATADECRRRASGIRETIAKAEPTP